MKQQLEDAISKARELSRVGNKDAAISLANELLEQYPLEARVWFLRGSLYSLKKDYLAAIKDITEAICIHPESHFFFNRGCYYFSIRQYTSAIEDFKQALSMDNYNDESYRQYLFFWRAETLIKLNKKQEALLDIACIGEDFKTWTFALRSKSDLIADCEKL